MNNHQNLRESRAESFTEWELEMLGYQWFTRYLKSKVDKEIIEFMQVMQEKDHLTSQMAMRLDIV